jgi:MSHA biogenesis protein MshL
VQNNKTGVDVGKFSLFKFNLILITLAFSACTHQTKVKPSTGHIDAKASSQANTQNATQNTAPIPKLVRAAPQLPPPKATSKAQTYSVVVNEVPVKEILFALARESKMNIDIHPSIQGRATLNAVDQTLSAILERLSRQVDLTYKMDGNVLYIAPDAPVLRIYKVDYVNMNRDTKGFIGAAAEISSTGQSASTGEGGSSSISSTSGNGANNSSRTSVDSSSKNHLWESLIQNVKDLLAETDKEVIVSRIGTEADDYQSETRSTKTNNGTTITINSDAERTTAAAAAREKAKSEYKTLLAANVIANAETGVISVRATNKQHEKVQEFIDRVMGSARRQVLIEATIVEVRLNDSFQAGIDWSRLNNGPGNSGFVFGQTLGSKGVNFNTTTGNFSAGENNALGLAPTAGLVAGYLNPASRIGNIAASITLLKQFGDTKVLSSPKLMVLNNQTAVLKVVDNLVYFTVQAQQSQGAIGGNTLSTITTTPNTVPVGVVMSVTPQINDTGKVNVNVRPTISRVLSFVRDPNPALNDARNGIVIPSQIPQIQVREMESILQIDSGNTAVLGGLMQDEIQRNTDAVPGLSDVPGVGNVFKGKNDATQKTELVIFLRPTVVPNASLESDELQSFKQFLPAQQLNNVLEDAQ